MSTRQKAKGSKKRLNGKEKPAILLSEIEIVPRPRPGEDKFFFNPRPPEDFDPNEMFNLRMSIRTDELLEDPIIRLVEIDGQEHKQLLAGERRIRTLKGLVDDDVPVYSSDIEPPGEWKPKMVVLHLDRFALVKKVTGDKVSIQYYDDHDQLLDEEATVGDEDLLPTAPASKVYNSITCKVVYNCSDSRAMRIAMSENRHQSTLSMRAQIGVTERLLSRGLGQKEVAYALATNVTWVSQTASFRDQLPEEAFDWLMTGQMSRNVAVNLLGYSKEDRTALFEGTVKQEQADTAKKIQEHRLKKELHEDQEEIEKQEATQAEKRGDTKSAAKHRKRANVERRKAAVEEKREHKAKDDEGKLTQSHLQKAAAELGIAPKKAGKQLSKADIESHIARLEEAAEGDTTDPVCKKKVPIPLARLGAAFLRGALEGLRDPFEPIRQEMIAAGKWILPDTVEDEDEEEDDEDDSAVSDEYDGEIDDPDDEDLEAMEQYMGRGEDRDNWD